MRLKVILLHFFLLILTSLQAVDFKYNLHLEYFPGASERTIVAFHGMGGNYKIGEMLKHELGANESIISFNFPDHDMMDIHRKLSYGTIDEILPAIYVLKKAIVDEKREEIDLYGFSAGGGAVINVLATLNSSDHDRELEKIGVTLSDKQKIVDALQKGTILLDAPLKSVQEVIDVQGRHPFIIYVANQYKRNGMDPIEAMTKLQGLHLKFLVYFEEGDTILSNRMDMYYIQKLKDILGRENVTPLIGYTGSHKPPHPTLFEYYQKNEHPVLKNPTSR